MLKSHPFKNIVIAALKILLAGGLLYWLYQKGVLDLSVLQRMLDPYLLVSSLTLLGVSAFIATWRWQQLLSVQGVVLTLVEAFKLNLVGLFFNYVMPGGVGGDVVKGYYIVKENPQNRMGAAVSVLLDRVMGLYAMLILAMVAMLFHIETIQNNLQLLYIARALCFVFIGFTFGLFLTFSKKFRRWGWQDLLGSSRMGKKLVSAYEAVHSYAGHKKKLLSVVILSLVSQGLAIITIWWLGQRMGFEDVSIATYLVVAPLGFMVTALPISPAGVGIGQMAFYFLFKLFLGQDTQVGPTVITAFQILNFLMSLFGLWFFIQRKSSLSEVETALGA